MKRVMIGALICACAFLVVHAAPQAPAAKQPLTIDNLFALYDTITPQDIRDLAAKYFVDKHRTIVTLNSKKEVAK